MLRIPVNKKAKLVHNLEGYANVSLRFQIRNCKGMDYHVRLAMFWPKSTLSTDILMGRVSSSCNP